MMRGTLTAAMIGRIVAWCAPGGLVGGCASSGMPSASADGPAGLRSLIAAERAFARRSETTGTKDAFVANLGPDGILFRPGPVNGLAWFRDRPGARGYLSWEPEWAEISSSGEMGYTTGPFEFRAGGASDTVAGAGHYVTVWRRDATGAWKMAVDIGTPHRFVPRPADAGGRVSGPTSSLGSNAWTLLQAQDSTIGAVAAVQSGPLLAAMTDDARLHRAGSLPAVGAVAVSQALSGDDRPYRSKGLGGGTSQAADFGYTYGDYELVPTAARQRGERGSYLRIWRRAADGAWRVTLDLAQPVP